MLTAAGRIGLADTELRAIIGAGSGFTFILMDRRGTLYDTRFVPGSKGPPADAAVLCVLVEGAIVWDDGTTFESGSAFVASAAAMEGHDGRRSRTFRAGPAPGGDRYRAVELRCTTETFTPALEPHGGPVRLAVDAAILDAARRCLELASSPLDPRARTERMRVLTSALHGSGALRQPLATESRLVAFLEPLWNVLAGMLEELAFSTTRDELAHRSATTPKRFQTELGRLALFAHYPFRGWRDLALGFRLRIAVLLLSNPEVPVRDIARRVGYSGTEALTHAFRAEGLPAPGDVRQAILAGRTISGGVRFTS